VCSGHYILHAWLIRGAYYNVEVTVLFLEWYVIACRSPPAWGESPLSHGWLDGQVDQWIVALIMLLPALQLRINNLVDTLCRSRALFYRLTGSSFWLNLLKLWNLWKVQCPLPLMLMHVRVGVSHAIKGVPSFHVIWISLWFVYGLCKFTDLELPTFHC